MVARKRQCEPGSAVLLTSKAADEANLFYLGQEPFIFKHFARLPHPQPHARRVKSLLILSPAWQAAGLSTDEGGCVQLHVSGHYPFRNGQWIKDNVTFIFPSPDCPFVPRGAAHR